ncbi:MAG: hypothetical protein GKR90_02240 [Pseudomonadales bacterium]|nr:hypothetical protein [Pseudomonadales bacterium]
MGKVLCMTLRNRAVTSALYLCMIATLFGCARNKPPEPILGIPEKQHEPWFCQTGEKTDSWDCVRDEELATSPRTTRSPPPSADGSDKTAPSFRRGRPAPTQRRPRPAAPARQAAAGNPPTSRESSDGTSRAVQEPKAAPQAGTVPRHIRLAYRPDKAVNLVDLPPEFWAVQLVALSSKEALEVYAKERGVRGMSAAEIAVNGNIFYVLLLGIYESKAIAQDAITDLKAPFQKPWLRTVGSLQAAMRAAEQINARR